MDAKAELPGAAPVRILMVDDNPADIELMQLSLREYGLSFTMDVCDDGEKAVDFLLGPSAGTRPDIVLLDLNLPRKDGREVLRHIKESPSTRNIPVLVLTTSAVQKELDMLASYPNTRCQTKPFLLEEYSRILKTIKETVAARGAQK